jgi:hypothetical protein
MTGFDDPIGERSTDVSCSPDDEDVAHGAMVEGMINYRITV